MESLQELDDILNEHFGRSETTHIPIDVDDDQSDADCEDWAHGERDEETSSDIERRVLDLVENQEGDGDDSDNGGEAGFGGSGCGPGGDACAADFDGDLGTTGFRCGCKVQCLYKFDDIDDHILNIRDMTKSEKEMLIMGALLPIEGKTWKGERQRSRYTYIYRGKKICKDSFKYVYDVGTFTLKAILKHLKQNGKIPRYHGNTNRRPHNALKYEQVRCCVDFIVRQGEEFGWPMPAAPRGRDDYPPVYLPASFTKKAMHKEYTEACQELSIKSVGLTSFKNIWAQCVPHIKISTPRDDVCQKCELISKKVRAATTEDEKLAASQSLQDHISHARSEREFYRETLARSQAETPKVRQPGPVPPCSTDLKYIHFTFDYSQQVTLPHHYRQMGPLYFMVPRRVQIFGVRDDGRPRQYNYLIDENESIGQDGSLMHGPNAVLSMLDHALTFFGYGEKGCVLHCDNCSGQNKNRYTLAYLCWRVMTGLHETIDLHMQIPGHTRCHVDGGFAHIKKLYRRSDVDGFPELASVVERSASTNEVVTYRNRNDECTWDWRNWKSFLEMYFRPFQGIQKYYHFTVKREDPGYVYVKTTVADEAGVRRSILKRGVTLDIFARPTIIAAAGLSSERQKYLYQRVRPVVRPEFQDITCPRPEA